MFADTLSVKLETSIGEVVLEVGRLVDKADNYHALLSSTMPQDMKLDAGKQALEEISAELKGLYGALTGTNPWDMLGESLDRDT